MDPSSCKILSASRLQLLNLIRNFAHPSSLTDTARSKLRVDSLSHYPSYNKLSECAEQNFFLKSES